MEDIIKFVNKETGASVYYDNDPVRLLDKLEQVYQETLLPHYNKLMDSYNPDGLPDD